MNRNTDFEIKTKYNFWICCQCFVLSTFPLNFLDTPPHTHIYIYVERERERERKRRERVFDIKQPKRVDMP